MTEFEQNPLERLAIQAEDIEDELDLGSLGVEAALQRLGEFIQQSANARARRYAVRFAPARGDGRLTLFQPVGRYLLQARQQGHIARCLPLPEGSGFYVELPAILATDKDDAD